MRKLKYSFYLCCRRDVRHLDSPSGAKAKSSVRQTSQRWRWRRCWWRLRRWRRRWLRCRQHSYEFLWLISSHCLFTLLLYTLWLCCPIIVIILLSLLIASHTHTHAEKFKHIHINMCFCCYLSTICMLEKLTSSFSFYSSLPLLSSFPIT